MRSMTIKKSMRAGNNIRGVFQNDTINAKENIKLLKRREDSKEDLLLKRSPIPRTKQGIAATINK